VSFFGKAHDLIFRCDSCCDFRARLEHPGKTTRRLFADAPFLVRKRLENCTSRGGGKGPDRADLDPRILDAAGVISPHQAVLGNPFPLDKKILDDVKPGININRQHMALVGWQHSRRQTIGEVSMTENTPPSSAHQYARLRIPIAGNTDSAVLTGAPRRQAHYERDVETHSTLPASPANSRDEVDRA
jgi:hypothetical protein